ncbi:MAG TPA: hypothetical protein VGT98_09375 [Candidatus Elarobacter sp.]|nr:hypothetical protein [Candidatus Elarobacter sp.]HEV2738967.1 hypothetical protein [Candidatus Elarobacter sp.]
MAKDKRARAKHEPSFSKTPRTGVQVHVEKQPKLAAEPHSIMDLQPAWRLSNLRMKEPFGWNAIARDDMIQVVEHLKSLESMTWSAILIGAKKHNHRCDVERMCRAAQTCLIEDWQGGADEILTMRLTNKKRVWGILEGPIVYLLWWDPTHAVYPSEPKNT